MSLRVPQFVLSLIAALATGIGFAASQTIYDVEIVKTYPHDPGAFTQGLFMKDGVLYESTGQRGFSSLRKIDLDSGEVVQQTELPPELFGEGVTAWGDQIIGLTWRAGAGFVYDLETLEVGRKFSYAGEGWGLTEDGERLIMSDGTSELRFLDPESLSETGRLTVVYREKPLGYLNELEWVDGEIFANVWKQDVIVRIDPATGQVAGVIDARPLRTALGPEPGRAEVLNGIAVDRETGRLFVTGKYWPKLFEIRLVERKAAD